MATHEEIVSAWQSLNADPRFTALPYDEQQKIRAQWAQRNLPLDPQFMQLSSDGQTGLFQRMVTQPPAFTQTSDFVKETLQLAQGIQQGDPEALRLSSFQIAGVRASQNAGPLYRLAVGVGETLFPDLEGMADINLSDDDKKAATYLQQQFQQSDDKTFWQSALVGTAPFVGLAANIASGRVAAQAPLAAVRPTGYAGMLFGRSGQAAAGTQAITGSLSTGLAAGRATRFGTWMMRSALPEAVESGLDAAMMSANDLITGQLQQNTPFGLDAKSTFGQLALNFGANFVGDMVFFGVTNLLGSSLRAGAKTFRRRGYAPKALAASTDEEFAVMASQFMQGKDLPQEVFASLPRETQQTFLRLKRVFAAANNLDDASPNDIARMVGLRRGYDMINDGGQIRLRPVTGNDYIDGAWSSETRALRGLYEFESVPTATSAKVMDVVLNNEAGIERVSRFEFGDRLPDMDTQTLARAFVPDASGQINPQTVRVATRSMLQKVGLDPDALAKVNVKQIPAEAYWKMSDAGRRRTKQLLVPDVVRTADDMTKFTERYSSDMMRLVPEGAQASNIKYINDAMEAVGPAPSPLNPSYVEADAIAQGVQLELLSNGLYRIGSDTFNSLEDAADYLHSRSILSSEDSIRNAFGKQYGFVFEQADDGQWFARGKGTEKGGNIFTGGHTSIEGAARELYEKGFRPKLGQEKALNTIINAEGTGIEISQGAIRGPLEYIRDYAKRFVAGTSDAQILRTFGTDTISKGNIENVFRVTSPQWGVVKEFSSYKKATEFLQKSRNRIEDLLEIGLLKGVPDIRITGGRIVARAVGEAQPYDFDSVKQLRAWLKARTPSPEWAKEISNLDQGTVDAVWDQIDPATRELYLGQTGVPRNVKYGEILDHMQASATWKQGGYVPSGEYGKASAYRGASTGIAQFIKDLFQTPTYARVRRLVGQTGQEILGEGFEAMEKNIKNARALTSQTSELLHGITNFDGAPKAKRRAVIRPILEVDPEVWDAKAVDLGIELSETDRRYLQRYRQASDAIGQAFGIDPYKMVSNYLPRIQRFMADNPDVVAGAANAREILGKMDARLPKELEFFSEYLRAEELSTFVNTADPQEILASYVRKGVKNMTLGKTYKRLMDQWNTAIGEGAIADPMEKFTMFRYLEATMGMYSDEATKAAEYAARETGMILARRLGAKGSTAVFKDYINTMHGFTIAATMSFRPWPVIRNLQQVWTTLAPMFGNDSVMRALKVMSNEKQAGEVYQRLLKTGRLQDRLPIYGGVYEATGKMGLVNKIGMKFYKNSDDYTRMMVDVVVRETFTDAVAKLESGVANERQFIRLANLHRLDDFDQREVLKRLAGYKDANGRMIAGSFENAVDYYGDAVTRETMFAYTAGSNPMMFNGMWGRLFGMFGHYPVYYAQTLLNGLRRGNLADKAIFAGRVVANSAALWFAFEQVMGIRADDFKPWKTMFFDGGPYFKLVTEALSTFAGSPDASWKQLRQDATRLFIPGSLQGRSVLQGLELMSKGQGYQGFLRLMSAPLADD